MLMYNLRQYRLPPLPEILRQIPYFRMSLVLVLFNFKSV